MKKVYEKPTIEITEFEMEDILANGLSVNEVGTEMSLLWDDIF